MSSQLDDAEEPLSPESLDLNDAFLYLTLILRQQQAIHQSQKELATLTASINHTLTHQAAAHARATRAAHHTARMADIESLMAREYDCLHSERQRTLQRKRELLPRLHAMQDKLQAMSRVKQEMDKEQRRMEERQQQLSEKRELLELRRRKLIMQVSGVFNIVPLHSKKERERKRERDKQKKPLSRYSLLRSKANPAASASQPPSSPPQSPLSSSPPPAPTSLSLTSHIPPARYYKLHDSILPPFHQMLTFDDEKVSTALGYAVLCVTLISKWSATRHAHVLAHTSNTRHLTCTKHQLSIAHSLFGCVLLCPAVVGMLCHCVTGSSTSVAAASYGTNVKAKAAAAQAQAAPVAERASASAIHCTAAV